jgi:hypothetical protein
VTAPESGRTDEVWMGSVPGTFLRPRPSGFIHCLDWVDRARSGVREADVLTFRCGREYRRRQVTSEFPPGGRRCAVCFPPEKTEKPHRIHTWERWDSMGDYGWKCLVCGVTTDEEPSVTVESLATPQSTDLRPCPRCGHACPVALRRATPEKADQEARP